MTNAAMIYASTLLKYQHSAIMTAATAIHIVYRASLSTLLSSLISNLWLMG